MGQVMIGNVEQIGSRFYLRHRYRENGKRVVRRVPLPPPQDPGFSAALDAARAKLAPLATNERAAPLPGTMAALCHAFRAGLPMRRNKRGKKLAEATLANYRLYADRIEREHGDKRIADIEPRHCYSLQDDLADTPGTANNYLSVLRLMLALACRRGWAKTNAAAGIPALPLGEHHPWPARVIEAALAEAQPMTRLALVTYLCSGQRGSDLIRMQHRWRQNGIMQLQQQKSGKAVAIPMHPIWCAEIDRLPKRCFTILYDRSGKPFQSVETLRERINDLLNKPAVVAAIAESVAREELPAGTKLTPHGFRKNAACYLSEVGLNDEEIGAILGMSPDMVRHYTRMIDVLRIANRVSGQVIGAISENLPGLIQNAKR